MEPPMNGRYKLVIQDWNPPLLNKAIRHWAKAKRLKDATVALLTVEAMNQGVPVAKCKRKVRLTVTLTTGRTPDKDGYDKCLLDCLVRSGLLTDDNHKGLEGRVEVEFLRAKEKRTVIELEDC